MLNEKHPDSFNWRNKLDEMNSLPGEEIMEKHAAWEKLHARLQEKPRRKKKIWYWAAACLLLGLLIQWMVAGKKEATFVNNTLPELEQKISADTSLPVPMKALVTERVFAVPEKQPKINDGKKNPILISTNTIVKAKVPVVAAMVSRQTLTEVVEPAKVPDTPITTVVKIVPVKKKMKIIHINEIEKPIEQWASYSYPKEKTFTSKSGNNNANNDNVPQQKEYTGVFKIKISSKN